MLALLPMNKPAVMEIVRRDNTIKLDLTPTEKGVVEGKDQDCPRWDFTIRSINQFDNPDLFFQRAKGVFVNGVKYPGNAAKAGLQPNDILVKIDGHDIQTLEEVMNIHQEALKNLDKRKKVSITVLRDGLTRLVSLDYSVDYKHE
jgi:membrane-associated protease RseP (regulator of RpoE activity)